MPKTAATSQPQQPQPARLVSRLHREPSAADKARKERGTLAGNYRVIHGRVAISRPESERLGADGKVDLFAPMLKFAEMGDIVFLSADDADRLVLAEIVEPESVPLKQSRMGKVWTPPKAASSYFRGTAP